MSPVTSVDHLSGNYTSAKLTIPGSNVFYILPLYPRYASKISYFTFSITCLKYYLSYY